MTLSFHTYWKPSGLTESDYKAEKQNLQDYFGHGQVLECLNRVDMKAVSCDKFLLDKLINKFNLSDMDSWSDAENFIGCLINEIDPYIILFLKLSGLKKIVLNINFL